MISHLEIKNLIEQKKKTTLKKRFLPRLDNKKGFSLIEVLVAIFLMLIVVATLNFESTFLSPRQKLDETIDFINRASRFASEEASLRNTIVRVRFNLDERPQQITVEYSTDTNFIIKKKSNKKEDSSNFTELPEFQSTPHDISDDITIQGIGSHLSGQYTETGEASIYFFPSGEKDESLVILSNEEEHVRIKLQAFQFENEIEFVTHNIVTGEEPDAYAAEEGRKYFREWLKN